MELGFIVTTDSGCRQRYTCIVDRKAIRHHSLIGNQFGDAPVLERPIWEVSPDDERDFSLRQLFYGDLERVRLAVEWNKDWGVHTVAGEKILRVTSLADLPDLQSPCTEDTSPLVLGQVSGGYPDLVWLAFAWLLCGYWRRLTVRHLLVTTKTVDPIGLIGVLLAI